MSYAPSSPGRRSPLRAVVCAGMLLSVLVCAPGGAGAADHEPPHRLIPVSGSKLLERVRADRASAKLVNVWATWCTPCREEFPDLLRLRQRLADRGFELLLVSADFDADRAKALRFLESQGVDFPSFVKTGPDMEFIDSLNPDWSGALPASFLYDAQGRLIRFWQGKASYEQLEKAILSALANPAG